MIYRSPANPNSHLTIKERTAPSFPTKQLFHQGRIQGKVLDFGCGLGIDIKFLQQQGYDIVGYDPYYVPEYPTEKFDTILCNYVLNVLLPEEQAHVLMAVSELLKPSGKAYFAVRRDITTSGFRTHTLHDCQVYQCNVMLPYTSILLATHCEIYEYQHITQRPLPSTSACSFCHPSSKNELLTESATAYTLLPEQPVVQGHAIIMPKQHISDYFALSERQRTACWLMLERVKTLLIQRYQATGLVVQIHTGSAANGKAAHAQIHVLPHYSQVSLEIANSNLV